MRKSDDVTAAMNEILTLLRAYEAGPADYVAELIELYPERRQQFREAALDNAIWGGAGSLCDVILYNRQGNAPTEDNQRLNRAIVRFAYALARAGLADERVLERAVLLEEIEERRL